MTITVYWSPWAMIERMTLMNLVMIPPKPIWKTLPLVDDRVSRADRYRSCPSATSHLKNTYVLSCPYTDTVNFSGDTFNPSFTATNHIWVNRNSSFVDSYAIDCDFQWIFFADQPLTMRVTPPYLHKTSVDSTGYLTSGRFDIHRWFRPVSSTFHLFPGETSLTMTEEEPLGYVEFDTEETVVLKQFELTQDIFEIANGSIKLKFDKPNLSLENLYTRFARSNRTTLLLNLIKDKVIG